jgi:hypothetical protein
METIFLLLLMGVMNLLAFLIGAKTAQKVDRGEEIKLPTLNPMKVYQEHMEQLEAKKEQETHETNMYNIDNYKGDGTGQRNFK